MSPAACPWRHLARGRPVCAEGRLHDHLPSPQWLADGGRVYHASIMISNNEEPPLICSMDGLETPLRYPELLCSHLVFLSAFVATGNQAKPVDGAEAGFRQFKNLRRTYGMVKKLLSFDVSVMNSLSMDVLNNAFLSVASGWLDGIDIRYMSGNEPSLHLFKDLRRLADSQRYIIHGVFDSVKIDVMKDFHIASLRVYKHPMPPGPFKAVSLQPTADIESGVQAYQAAVQGANLAGSGNHCIALSLAAVQYTGARTYGDNAVDFLKALYCTVRKIGRLPHACLLLDDIYYDRHTCTCDDMNFKLLKTARQVLWQTLKG
ncbi:uncharacterized protein LOC119434101 isoform X2 [Dermacentor silvarum]|uniref:uncharacterized protein LOC119434101 isoform X2 n=1 Tax=Dermacentor silvarum TaxID=543639 RepID=UPI0021014205|nr:uncharacterized protein LOC119434101 isoform X2 [Dermacentor silvarum]